MPVPRLVWWTWGVLDASREAAFPSLHAIISGAFWDFTLSCFQVALFVLIQHHYLCYLNDIQAWVIHVSVCAPRGALRHGKQESKEVSQKLLSALLVVFKGLLGPLQLVHCPLQNS